MRVTCILVLVSSIVGCGSAEGPPPLHITSQHDVHAPEPIDSPRTVERNTVEPKRVADEVPTGQEALTAVAEDKNANNLRELSVSEKAILAGLPTERIAAPEQFYYRTNERRHDLFVNKVGGVGGALIGVGADQCYTLAAIAKSSMIFAVDYDSRVPMVHRIYQALIPKSATVDELIAKFAKENQAATEALLSADMAGESDAARVLRMFKRIRKDMHPYLQEVKTRSNNGVPASWLATTENYEHIRKLFLAGRVVARTGDVTGKTTLRAVGKASHDLGIPIRVVYFSNAEQFFKYTKDFQENMKSFKQDDKTIVVRTTRHKTIKNAVGDTWHYVVQDFVDFRERIESGYYPRAYLFIKDLVKAGAPQLGEEFSHMTTATPRTFIKKK